MPMCNAGHGWTWLSFKASAHGKAPDSPVLHNSAPAILQYLSRTIFSFIKTTHHPRVTCSHRRHCCRHTSALAYSTAPTQRSSCTASFNPPTPALNSVHVNNEGRCPSCHCMLQAAAGPALPAAGCCCLCWCSRPCSFCCCHCCLGLSHHLDSSCCASSSLTGAASGLLRCAASILADRPNRC